MGKSVLKQAARSLGPGRPPGADEFNWGAAAIVLHALAQTGSLRGVERTLRPARSTIRAWRASHPAFALLVAIAQEMRVLMRKVRDAKRAGYPEDVWGTYDDEARDYCNVIFFALRHIARSEGLEFLSPEFDREMTEYATREAKRLRVKA